MEQPHISELVAILHQLLSWNKSRITCMAKLILGLFVVRTVNLTAIATTFSGSAKIDSNYKRIQRFVLWLSERKLYQGLMIRIVQHQIAQDKFCLSLDRTNWKFRGADINILVLGLWYQGVSIPLLWFCLDQTGCCNSEERIKIITDLLETIDSSKIDFLLADREFIGEKWFKFLINKNIRFSIRIKNCLNVKIYRSKYYKTVKTETLFKTLKKGSQQK